MAHCRVLDTSDTLLDHCGEMEGQSPAQQADWWLARFHADWPALAAKLEGDYAADGFTWRTVLIERVFPTLAERLPAMRATRDRLLPLPAEVMRRAEQVFRLDFAVVFVILPIGYGGWGTSCEDEPAVLLGLDTIVGLGWTDGEALTGLVAHELGHVLHQVWRKRVGLEWGRGPFWLLYDEGFGQRCEHVLVGYEDWHMARGQDDWLAWCQAHTGWLAAEYLRAVAAGEPVYRFFGGSWPEYHIEGRHQCAYFLGHEIIRQWEGQKALKEIALLPVEEADRRVREALEAFSSA